MSKPTTFIALAVSSLLLQGAGAADSGKSTSSFRWKDKDGVIHYGDSVPPEYSSQGRSELNPQGVPLRQYPRQLSPEEEREAQKLASDVKKRQQHDDFLLTTYTQVRDIEQLRDERLALIDGQMEIARGSISSSDQKITSVQDRMRNFQPYSASPGARRMPDQLAEEAVRALKERRGLVGVLQSREAEKTELREQFDADIARYRELTSRPGLR
jgi:hypothetical protein